MYYILLSGGSGKRLWPLSSEVRPKQYLKILHRENNSMESASMLQRVWEQLEEAGIDSHTVITAEENQTELIYSQIKNARIAVEPKRRDTFAAILLSCLYLKSELKVSEEEYITVLTVDLYTEGKYFETLKSLEEIMKKEKKEIGLLGVRPTYPATKYGYILPGEKKENFYTVKSFYEKPDEKTAEQLLQKEALWNCGVFCVKVGSILERGKRYTQAETYSQLIEEYEKLPQISFDYEVLENSKDLLVVPFQGYWKDLGTWESMAEQMRTDTLGNVILGDNCRETQVINELNLPVVVNGTKNLVVVASKEGILVADKSYTENLKDLVAEIKTKPLFEERRWGTLETLNETEDEGNITFTRKIRIFGGMNSSYHFHKERDEIWTVLKGKGELILEGSKLTGGMKLKQP